MPDRKPTPNKNKKGQSHSQKVSHGDKSWDVHIYMAGDNNLIQEAIWALTEIREVYAQLKNIKLQVQFDHGQHETLFDFATPNPAFLNHSRKAKKKTFEKALLGLDAITIKKFKSKPGIESGLKALLGPVTRKNGNHKGQLRALILSGHSSANPLYLLTTLNPQKQMTLGDLRKVLEKQKGKIDLLGLDSCTMSSIETIFELHGVAEFLVAPQGYEDNTGWPYRQMLTALKKNGKDAKQAAKSLVKEYINFYDDYVIAGVSSDLAACDLSEKDALHNAVQQLALLLCERCDDRQIMNAILLSHWHAQSYKFELTVDLWDFCDLLKKACDDAEVSLACRAVQAAVKKCVVLNSWTGAATQHSHGISIYFPWSVREWMRDRNLYQQLSFAKSTHWDEFLDKFLTKTQRLRREDIARSGKVGDRSLWIMPFDSPEASPHRVDPDNNIKVDPDNNIKVDPDNNIKVDPDNNIKVDPDNNIKLGLGSLAMGKQRIARMKNPPEEFYRYEDECVV